MSKDHQDLTREEEREAMRMAFNVTGSLMWGWWWCCLLLDCAVDP